MKFFLILSFISLLFSCLNSSDEMEFFVSDLVPQSGEFEDTIKVDIHFTRPLNREKFSDSNVQIVDSLCENCLYPISAYSFNEEGDILTIYAENIEPEKNYKLLLKGSILSTDNLLLSYYYGGNYLSNETYFIKGKKNLNPCLVINEVLNYPDDRFGKEFIELFNCSDSEVDLRGYFIKVDENRPQRLLFRNGSFRLAAMSQRIILSDVKEFTTEPLIYVDGKFGKNGLSNTSLRSIQLLDERGMILNEFRPFLKTKKGVSFERINPHISSNERNWGYSIAPQGSTPDMQNSIYMRDIFPPQLKGSNTIERNGDIEIRLEFDEDVYCEYENCLYLISDDGKKIMGITKISDGVISFSPIDRLDYESEYSIVATSILKDNYGNSYPQDTVIGRIKTPDAPPLLLYYPSMTTVYSNTKYLEFVSKKYNLNEASVYLVGMIQKLRLTCVTQKQKNRYLCTISDDIEGPEDMTLFVNGEKTDISINFIEPYESQRPELKIINFFQIKDNLFVEVDSSVPCMLFVDFIYKEDLDEGFSYSSYSFGQRFEYIIHIQDAYKEYFVNVYCIDVFNQSSDVLRYRTREVSQNEESVIINEILPNPVGVDSASEFIEIINIGRTNIKTNLISIGDCNGNNVQMNKFSKDILSPNEIGLIVSNNSTFYGNNPQCLLMSGADKIINRDLRNNSPETLCLFYNGVLMDVFNSKLVASKEGTSIVRVNKSILFDSSNWIISNISGGTPCKDL
ncbi:MAG: hypothetical protein ACP5QK_07010 [Myxococcota bacterium]